MPDNFIDAIYPRKSRRRIYRDVDLPIARPIRRAIVKFRDFSSPITHYTIDAAFGTYAISGKEASLAYAPAAAGSFLETISGDTIQTISGDNITYI